MISEATRRRWRLYEYKPNPWALEHVHNHAARFKALTTARQTGKTEAACFEIDRGLFDKDPFGNPAHVGVLAPTYDKAELSVGRFMEKLTQAFGRDFFQPNKNKHQLYIPSLGSKLQWLSSDDPYSVVGYTFSKLVVDEAQAVPDIVWEKIRPTLDVLEAPVVAFGTPDITLDQSWFKGMFLRGQESDESPDYHSYTVSCYENQWMSMDTIIDARNTLSDREFRMLYLGEWVDDEGSVFPHPENAVFDLALEGPAKGRRYVMGVDFAIHEDFNVLMIGEAGTRQCVYMDRWNKTDPVATYDRIAEAWVKWNRPLVVADETGMGEPMIHELRERGIKVRGIKLTAQSKMPMLGRLASDIEHRRIMYPKWDILLRELKGFMYKKTPSGRIGAEAAAGYHDDCVIALALLAEGMRRGAGNTVSYNYLDSRPGVFA